MGKLKDTGHLMGLLGGFNLILSMTVYALARLFPPFASAVNRHKPVTPIMGFSLIELMLGEPAWMVSAISGIFCGFFILYGFYRLEKTDVSTALLLRWGILYVLLGIVGGVVAASPAIVAGILFLLEYFKTESGTSTPIQ
ncbi:MAG: hypothetical protein ACFFD4_08955 [Candidatus Odinarchaeota archaeon]